MGIDEHPPGGAAGARYGAPADGGGGPFGQGVGERILPLARDDPKAALAALRKVIGSCDDCQLEALVVGRQDATCALGEIARTPDHFEEAARLLLRLAATESGSSPNSAANVFARLFANVPSSMASTRAGADERATLLAELLDSGDKRTRLLALSACGMALKTTDFELVDCESGRVVMEARWAIVGKEFEVYKKALAMLVERLGRMDPGERQEAVEIVLEGAVKLSAYRETSCEAAAAVRVLYEKGLADRQRLIQAAEMAAGAYAGRMGEKALAAWRSLAADAHAGAGGTP